MSNEALRTSHTDTEHVMCQRIFVRLCSCLRTVFLETSVLIVSSLFCVFVEIVRLKKEPY